MSLAQQKGALFGKAAAGSKTAVAGAANPTSTLPPPPGRTAGVTFKATTVGQGGSLGMSNEQKEKKMKEARELSEQGMKHLKTSMMQVRQARCSTRPPHPPHPTLARRSGSPTTWLPRPASRRPQTCTS